MILPKVRDPRLVTIRRGGTLTDADHQLLARWAATCAEHVLPLFEAVAPDDPRPREAIAAARAWADGDLPMMQARALGGQAGVVAHVAEHDLGAAAYAIKAVRASVLRAESDGAGRAECRWQRAQLPEQIRALVLEDQARRNDICWSVFEE